MSTWDILQIFLILALMMGMLYGLLFLIKKYLYSYQSKGDSGSKIEIISTQVLMPKKYVSVIKFNSSFYLLGVSDNSVNLIDKLDNECLENPLEENIERKQSFLSLLKSNMGIG
ncbi:MAG: hypothetical protein CR986_01495 [Ignavibacteriae bacterium]|nr:MAG: hypothetical protein CR986_01495 [Ignavibacteriota bacterium]